MVLEGWQTRWADEEEDRGRFTYNIFPEVKTTRCIVDRYVTQAMTNHGLCPYYLKRFNLRDCNCRCGEDTEDGIHHYIFWCPLVQHLRKLNRPGMDVAQAVSHPKRVQEIRSALSFVYTNQSDIFEDNT
ncbi:hypothetical protein AVEN_164558-1 [Araneus ventricosus]|uniref:Reverse transcriptase zinc-binding domain-containing protein n=1 Tax=Araneus ventricosus TaxID=182803 RepID=A0A4Y2B314_ARAVE|nr:hypothetical protein AVEN_164558-1 [Araneus ventricosus]